MKTEKDIHDELEQYKDIVDFNDEWFEDNHRQDDEWEHKFYENIRLRNKIETLEWVLEGEKPKIDIEAIRSKGRFLSLCCEFSNDLLSDKNEGYKEAYMRGVELVLNEIGDKI